MDTGTLSLLYLILEDDNSNMCFGSARYSNHGLAPLSNHLIGADEYVGILMVCWCNIMVKPLASLTISKVQICVMVSSCNTKFKSQVLCVVWIFLLASHAILES